MDEIVSAVESGDADRRDFSGLGVPESYRGCVVLKDEAGMFEGMASADKDPAKSMRVREVPTPELEPGEALIAVMASAINDNTVWSAIFEPLPTFSFLERYGRTGPAGARHNQDYHVLGSDLSGVVLRTGPGVTRWKPGDRVVAHCLSARLLDALPLRRRGGHAQGCGLVQQLPGERKPEGRESRGRSRSC